MFWEMRFTVVGCSFNLIMHGFKFTKIWCSTFIPALFPFPSLRYYKKYSSFPPPLSNVRGLKPLSTPALFSLKTRNQLREGKGRGGNGREILRSFYRCRGEGVDMTVLRQLAVYDCFRLFCDRFTTELAVYDCFAMLPKTRNQGKYCVLSIDEGGKGWI